MRPDTGEVGVRTRSPRGALVTAEPPAAVSGSARALFADLGSLRWALSLALACLLGATLRLLYAGMPLTADEGGYAEVARLWARGAELYHEAWADRPQGLLLVFRALVELGGSTEAIRLAAVIVAGGVIVGCALVARRVFGERTGIFAALLAATAGASPFLESYTLSGELIASLLAVASMLAFVVYLERRRPALLFAAGLLTGCALLVKQSAFDAGLAALVCLLWTERSRAGARRAALLAGGMILPLALAAASAPDLGSWWRAVVIFRLEGDSLFSGPLGYRLGAVFAGVFVAMAALAVPSLVAVRGWKAVPLPLRLWLVCGLLGVAGGGSFWAHYWTQIVPALSIIAAAGLVSLLDSGALRSPLKLAPLAAACLLSLVTTFAPLLGDRGGRVEVLTPRDTLRLYDEDVAAYVSAHTAAGDQVLIVPTGAPSVYFLADREPAFRYIWLRPTRSIPGAIAELRASVERSPPRLVVLYPNPELVDPTGALRREIAARYRPVADFGPVRILAPRAT